MVRLTSRSGGAFRYDGGPSRSGAGLADDSIAALANVTGAITAHAGLLHRRGRALVVNRKAFSEIHSNILCAPLSGSGCDIIDASLSAQREFA
jgi:hypothetical protein